MNWAVFFGVLGILAGTFVAAVVAIVVREWLEDYVGTDASFAIVLAGLFLAAATITGVLTA